MNKGLCTVSHASVHFRQHEHNVYFASLFHVLFFFLCRVSMLPLFIAHSTAHINYIYSVCWCRLLALVHSLQEGYWTSWNCEHVSLNSPWPIAKFVIWFPFHRCPIRYIFIYSNKSNWLSQCRTNFTFKTKYWIAQDKKPSQI